MRPILASTMILVTLFATSWSVAQPVNKNAAKPYRILTSGKEVTIKSTKPIQAVMVWTASGHRIVEQKNINAASFTFSIRISEKIFFAMVQYKDNERYTEKIGLRE